MRSKTLATIFIRLTKGNIPLSIKEASSRLAAKPSRQRISIPNKHMDTITITSDMIKVTIPLVKELTAVIKLVMKPAKNKNISPAHHSDMES